MLSAFRGEPAGDYNLLKWFVTSLAAPRFNERGFDITEEDGHVVALGKAEINRLLGLYEYPACVAAARIAFEEFRSNGSAIDPDLQQVVYEIAIRTSLGNDEFEFLWDELLHISSPGDVKRIIYGLASSRYVLRSSFEAEALLRSCTYKAQSA